ncbi:MAG: thioredoxin-disulfide reductase [Flavobacteriales bacterium]
MSVERLKTLIIGSGPAGYTAAIYASRADLSPVMYTGMQMGGQLTTTTEVDNFPGYPTGITGTELMEDLKQQAERFGTEVRFGVVTKVNLSKERGGVHKITVNDGAEEKIIETKTVIISTGASAKYLGLESETRLMGGGVSACATCDGFFYKGKDVIVVGGGDTAAEEATYLANMCNKVYLAVRRDEFRASKAMVHRVKTTQNIEILFNTEVEEILGESVVEGVRVVNNQTGEKKEIKVDGYFSAIGHKPNTELFVGQLNLDKTGYIITEADNSKTGVPGVFAAGDVQDHVYRQAITAAGSGCIAAIDAERYIAELDH